MCTEKTRLPPPFLLKPQLNMSWRRLRHCSSIHIFVCHSESKYNADVDTIRTIVFPRVSLLKTQQQIQKAYLAKDQAFVLRPFRGIAHHSAHFTNAHELIFDREQARNVQTKRGKILWTSGHRWRFKCTDSGKVITTSRQFRATAIRTQHTPAQL